MRTKIIPIVCLLISESALSATYLCVAEAGAGISHTGNLIEASTYDVTSEKYVISNDSGEWKFKRLGYDASLLVCESEFYCEVPGGFAGVFMREKSGVFTYAFNTIINKNSTRILYSLKGFCSGL